VSSAPESTETPARSTHEKSLETPPADGWRGDGRGRVAGLAPLRLSVAPLLRQARFAFLVYLGSRLLLLVLALVEVAVRHHTLISELQIWDGGWYRALATDGYPHHALHTQTTLGFFPLYPLLIWVVWQPLQVTAAHITAWHAAVVAGVVISGIGGLIASYLVQRLAAGWWGEAAGRRAVILFCFFPGSIVFSLVYAEGIMIPLAAGCILALQRRRWLLAGVLAGVATATEPEAVVLIVVCAVSAALELRRRGWRDPVARRALVAPALAPAGLVGVLAFLWAWTGTPLAYWTAQHYGWKERFDLLAVPHLAIRLSHHISLSHFNHPTINLNWPLGLIGAVLFVFLLVLMFRIRRTISVAAWTWTLGIGFLALTSEYVPPNPRLLITAFPAVIVLAYYCRRRAFAWVATINAVLLVGMSWLTFVSVTLRP
jgi:Mannosyltransferase (PIG-V)